MKKRILGALVLSSVLFSCSNIDFGSTNQNQNGTQTPDAGALMTGAMLDFSTNTNRAYLNNPTHYAQYQSQVVYTSESRYGESKEEWTRYYTRQINNLNTLIKYISDPANQSPYVLAQGSINNQIGVSKIFRSYVIKRVTDTYGDVPFSQAALGLENLTPAYDKQEDIYKAIIADLKAGRDMISASETAPKGDVILKGNITRWKKLANSLIMSACIQLSNRYPNASDYPAQEFLAALNDANGSIETVADEAWFTYDTQNGFRNPFAVNRSTDFRLTQELTDSMKGRGAGSYNRTSNHTNDPRLAAYATSTAKDGLPYGYSSSSLAALGINASTTVRSQMASRYRGNDSTLPMFTSAYSLLNRAEAAALGWTSENATTLLTTALTQSFASLNAKYTLTLNGATYSAARLVDASASTAMLKQVIREEKWIVLYPNGFQAWTEQRRTGVPALLPAPDYLNNGKIPGRYNYPNTEANLNSANYAAGVTTLSPASDNNSSKVWWAQ